MNTFSGVNRISVKAKSRKDIIWKNVPVQTNPGGDGVVVFIGLAAPVKTPLIGPPRQP